MLRYVLAFVRNVFISGAIGLVIGVITSVFINYSQKGEFIIDDILPYAFPIIFIFFYIYLEIRKFFSEKESQ